MIRLELNQIIDCLGEPVRKRGAEYEWQCPYCMDGHEDNLKFNEHKGILYCFANPEHSKTIFQEICKRNKIIYSSDRYDNYSYASLPELDFNFETKEEPIKNKEILEAERAVDFHLDMCGYNEVLLKDEKALNFLLEKRGINKNTVKSVYLGIDYEKNRWVIPTIRYNTEIIDFENNTFLHPMPCGFEYRPLNLSKKGICREKDCPTCLAQINDYTEKTKILTVVEGYFDGYALFQYLTEIGKIHLYHIVTPSNGINGLFKQIDSVDFDKYKRFELFIDNDEPAQKVASQILEKYPFFNRVELACGCKDFNEHYMKCIKG